MAGEFAEGVLLPLPAAGGGFEDPVFEGVQEFGAGILERVENVGGEAAVMGAGFEDLSFLGHDFEPIGELGGEEFAEERADADAGEKVAFFARVASNCS